MTAYVGGFIYFNTIFPVTAMSIKKNLTVGNIAQKQQKKRLHSEPKQTV